MIAKAREIELERFRLQQPRSRHVIDHEMRKVRLAGDRAQRGEFRRREPRDIIGVFLRIGHAVEFCLLGYRPRHARPSCKRTILAKRGAFVA